ncbi:hypothetical protein M3P21_11600 [Ruegeria sp. 2012CJ41-6]|uniref:Calcineurin-like phosphoesterase domain-containing protein n=1 Tax=Ruegeria spongiae TaxID=2942209 RepID=A0ABT0Q2R8_9RHOB|nr:hypothetical protein [Ruegeria spongiae]MCL6284170.1 hypothetical protein [Ruegeria spongiae]
MSDIRYICLSDMHFGADNSILTRLTSTDGAVDSNHPSDLLVQLVGCLRHLINSNHDAALPTLILNGDILDLAFSTKTVSAMAFQQFLELAMPEDPDGRLFSTRMIYLPGNHDHNLWQTCRERRFADQLATSDWRDRAPPVPHTTPLLNPDPLPNFLLEAIGRRLPWLSDFSVETVYPNLAFATDDKLVIYTHGHFIEDVYLLASSFADSLFPDTKPPVTMEQWEAQNFAWIDFVWSVVGRSGRIGPDEEVVYNLGNSPAELGALAGAAVRRLLEAKAGPVGKSLGVGAGELVSDVVGKAFERGAPQHLLNDGGAGLRRFMQVPVQGQIRAGYSDRPVPNDIAVVFGHTHKPFEKVMEISDFPTPRFTAVNSGGWVVDSPAPQPLIGGAAVLMDADLNLASLRMYNEADAPGDYRVALHKAGPAEADNPLFDRLSPLVTADQWPWAQFSEVACLAVKTHNDRLKAFLAQHAPPGSGSKAASTVAAER